MEGSKDPKSIVQQIAARLCKDSENEALAAKNKHLENPQVNKVRQQALEIDKHDKTRFNSFDLNILERKYGGIDHFDAQLRHLNRGLLDDWKEKIKQHIGEQEKQHINKKAKESLRQCAAWNTINYWLTWPSKMFMAPGDILEMYYRAHWVNQYSHLIIGVITEDTWSEDPDVLES
ncbi:MAG: hypothetical protein Q9209_001942 [Squamulea sp. 1 TL-2023]